MFRKSILGFASFLFVLVVFGTTVSAQFPARGTVTLVKADGTKAPVADAVIDAYRTDIATGTMTPVKTNKNGEFVFAMPTGRKYTLTVSGPGLAPAIARNISGGMENVDIIVYPGDGRRFTEEEARSQIKEGAELAPKNEEEAKKAREEYEKKLAKYNEDKARNENVNKIVNDALKAGDEAFKAKNYDLAVSKFDEGINADPDFEGSAPILLNYKGVALKQRAFDAYQRAAKDPASKDAEMAKAKADFLASIAAYDQGLKVLASVDKMDAATKSAGGVDPANSAKAKYNLLSNSVESYRLIVRTKADISKAKDAGPTFEQYFAVEADPAKKLSARLILADIMREAGESEAAIAAYRVVLETAPDNPDALAGIGLSLFNVGVSEENKPKMQEGLNYMQKFADTAPDTHALKASVKDAVDYLKNEQKLAPQKTTSTKKKT